MEKKKHRTTKCKPTGHESIANTWPFAGRTRVIDFHKLKSKCQTAVRPTRINPIVKLGKKKAMHTLNF